MLLYRIKNPQPPAWATGLDRGAWEIERCHEPEGPLVWFHPRPPLRLEWDIGDKWHRNPTRLGDFVHAVPRLVAKAQVAAELAARFQGFELSPVILLPGPRELRFDDSTLLELFPSAWAHADMERSTWEESERCPQCQRSVIVAVGEEIREGDFLMDGAQPVAREDRPRPPRAGVFVPEPEAGSASVFRTHEFGGIFATQEFVDYVRRRGFTNIEFREVGETF